MRCLLSHFYDSQCIPLTPFPLAVLSLLLDRRPDVHRRLRLRMVPPPVYSVGASPRRSLPPAPPALISEVTFVPSPDSVPYHVDGSNQTPLEGI